MQIYTWFYRVFKASVGLGSVGYVMLLTQVFGGVPFFFADGGTAVVLVWYGLYYGILTRDCAEVASDRIANRLGGARRLAVSVRDCGICGAELRDAHGGGGTGAEASVQLSCKHLFHEECIRGWLIVGKKDSCPTCTEKVDLRALYAGKPWETSNLSWVQMLDMVRYLVVWQPTILVALHFLLHVAHLDEAPAGGGGGVGNNGSLVGAAVNGSAGNATFGGGGAFLG
jgi:RING finger protein 121